MNEIEVWWQRIGCMNNPGAHCGEEAARDAEIKELRAYIKDLENRLDAIAKAASGEYDDWMGYDH